MELSMVTLGELDTVMHFGVVTSEGWEERETVSLNPNKYSVTGEDFDEVYPQRSEVQEVTEK
jgi:hypothetical protein